LFIFRIGTNKQSGKQTSSQANKQTISRPTKQTTTQPTKIAGGMVYMAAIIDWHSKAVLSHKISNKTPW
jgi:putative transposase